MREELTAGYGERIKRALVEGPRPMSVRQLGAEMEERYPEMRGATYGGVRQYVAGNIRSPRVELLRAIADVLEVRPEYIAFHDGDMTDEGTRARREVGDHADVARTDEDAEEAFRAGARDQALHLKLTVLREMGALPERLRLEGSDDLGRLEERLHGWAQRVNLGYIPPWVPALAEGRARYRRGTIDAEALGRALRGPLEAVGIDPSTGVDATYRTQEWLDDYIAGMVPVLLALATERRRQRDATPEQEEAEDAETA